jgi:hypothetical protein
MRTWFHPEKQTECQALAIATDLRSQPFTKSIVMDFSQGFPQRTLMLKNPSDRVFYHPKCCHSSTRMTRLKQHDNISKSYHLLSTPGFYSWAKWQKEVDYRSENEISSLATPHNDWILLIA